MSADYYFDPDEEYVEWITAIQFRTMSLAVIVNGQPLLMPLEAFKWADRRSERLMLSTESSLLWKRATTERSPLPQPASPTKPSESGRRTFLSLLTRWKRPKP